MPQGIEAPASSTAEGQTSHTLFQVEGLAKLRVPFPKDQINPLPKITCGKCSKSPTKECDKHRKGKCHECNNWITSAHMHLDYVGHAELTNRLLDADPLWDWEPLALDERGLPVFDGYGGLWIRLTVCGHSRLGYGDSQGKTGPNAIKEAIGDALRNAAMRFGAALDLWAKSDLREAQSEHPKSAEDDVRTAPAASRQEQRPPQTSRPEADPEQKESRVTVVQSTPNTPPQRERRDYLAEAQAAESADAVRALWQEAKQAGAPTDYLDQIVAVGRERAASAEARAAAYSSDPEAAGSEADYDRPGGETRAAPLDALAEQGSGEQRAA